MDPGITTPNSPCTHEVIGQARAPSTSKESTTSSSSSDASTSSDNSAKERLQWRSHPAVVSPTPQVIERNPFDDADLIARKKGRRRKGDEDAFSGAEEVEDGGGGAGVWQRRGRNVERMGEREGNRDGGKEKEKDDEEQERSGKKKLSFRERIRHFTWTWFCMTMATGGIANVLYTIPFRFRGLYALGCIFFLLNIVLFLFNVVMISCRFYFYPRTFKASFLHPTESLFIPAATVSFGIILINVSQYGVDMAGVGQWLEECMIILFWLDCGIAVTLSIGIYLLMWSTTTFTISQMTPIWIFPAYPLLIIGPHAGTLAPKVDNPQTALTIILTGYIIQGIGFLVSLMIYAAFIYRLMTQKLPKESLRPGMFISVGPSGFTIAGVIGMGQELPRCVGPDFMGAGNGELAGKVGMICANYMGLWLWGLALWFFFVSVGAHWSCARRGKMDFAMTWYSFIFPNTALTTSTFAIARALNGNRTIEYVGCAMTIALLLMWFFVITMNVRAVVIRQILWPEKQEDRTEGGWKQQSAEEQRRRAAQREDGGEGGEMGRQRTWSMVRTFSRRGRVDAE